MQQPCVIYEFGELQKPTSTNSLSGKLEDLPLSLHTTVFMDTEKFKLSESVQKKSYHILLVILNMFSSDTKPLKLFGSELRGRIGVILDNSPYWRKTFQASYHKI
jgi:hypothetical protein